MFGDNEPPDFGDEHQATHNSPHTIGTCFLCHTLPTIWRIHLILSIFVDIHTHAHTVPESLGIHSLVGRTDAKITLIKTQNYYESGMKKMLGSQTGHLPQQEPVLVVQERLGGYQEGSPGNVCTKFRRSRKIGGGRVRVGIVVGKMGKGRQPEMASCAWEQPSHSPLLERKE